MESSPKVLNLVILNTIQIFGKKQLTKATIYCFFYFCADSNQSSFVTIYGAVIKNDFKFFCLTFLQQKQTFLKV